MLSAIGISLVVVTLVANSSEESETSQQQFQALKREHDAAFQAFVQAQSNPDPLTEAAKAMVERGRQPRTFAPGFMALARKYPGTEAAEDSLVWVASHVMFGPETEEAKKLLARDHIQSAKLAPVFAFQRTTCGSSATEHLLREAMARNPHRDIQASACFWLARYLSYQAQWSREARRAAHENIQTRSGTLIPPSPIVVEGWGADYIDRVRRLDPEALEREAEALFKRVSDVYADILHNDKHQRDDVKTFGDAALGQLHEMQHLAIGKLAPEVEGKDIEGRSFRLSDYRGKVVVLNFGSHFYCGFCRNLYPQERSLVKELEGKPFALVNINAEPSKDPTQLKEAWKAAGNTWRCVWDGNYDGPINNAWNIQQYPTTYVLDPKGVIRHKNVFGEDLHRAVSALLQEMPSSKDANP